MYRHNDIAAFLPSVGGAIFGLFVGFFILVIKKPFHKAKRVHAAYLLCIYMQCLKVFLSPPCHDCWVVVVWGEVISESFKIVVLAETSGCVVGEDSVTNTSLHFAKRLFIAMAIRKDAEPSFAWSASTLFAIVASFHVAASRKTMSLFHAASASFVSSKIYNAAASDAAAADAGDAYLVSEAFFALFTVCSYFTILSSGN